MYLASLPKWLSVRLRTKWLWVGITLLPLKFIFSFTQKNGLAIVRYKRVRYIGFFSESLTMIRQVSLKCVRYYKVSAI